MRITNVGTTHITITLLNVQHSLIPNAYIDLKDEDYHFVYEQIKKIDDLEITYPSVSGNNLGASGKVTLGIGGSITILTPNIHSTSLVFLTSALVPINGKLHYDTIVDGVSFNVHAGNNSDIGHVIDWMVINN